MGRGVTFRMSGCAALLLALAACGEDEVLLSGERLDARGAPIVTETLNRSVPLVLPAAVANVDWTHPGGNARHQQSHVALSSSLTPVWSVSIGEGNGRKHRLLADPVVANGLIFTLDSRARLSAHSTSGALVWTTDLTPSADNADEASGGGIAAAGGRVFVSSGFGTLTALEASSGEVLWTQDLEVVPSGAPMVSDGVVYVATENAVGWAISAENGRVLWQVLGAGADRSIASGASPAIAGELVVFPFSSGQMVSAVAGVGNRAWVASVAGERIGRSFGIASDLTGSPIVGNNTVFAGSQAGRAAAFDATTGETRWRADEGALGPMWLAGGSLFFVSDENRLIRMDAANGEVIWAQNLPQFKRERLRRRKATFIHYGPVLASGRLILASDDGGLRQYDPETGSLISNTPLPDEAARNPVVAGGTMYLVTGNGQLHAFR